MRDTGLGDSLQASTQHLERTGAAAELVDPEWRLVWVSPELRRLMGDPPEDDLGLGQHYLATRDLPAYRPFVDETTMRTWTTEIGPYMAADTPGGAEALRGLVDDRRRDALAGISEVRPPPLWTHDYEVTQPGTPTTGIGQTLVRLHDNDGSFLGTVLLYRSPLRATVLALVARGDEEVFARMASLMEPEQRPTALLFADLEASGRLSRQLAGQAYFRLIRSLRTAIDDEVGRRGGVIGKHAGDGVTAFFVAEQVGGASAAARAAVETGFVLHNAASDAAQGLAEDGLPIKADDCTLNVGLHWGANLVVGQIVTGGRLEVTALGDEVNECARIEQTASEGAILGSKDLLEQLSDEDARAIGLASEALRYTPLSDHEEAGDKARRDAGALAVVDLSRAGRAEGNGPGAQAIDRGAGRELRRAGGPASAD